MTIANTLPILAAVTIATWLGDYFIKTATLSPDGLRHPNFAIGSVLYGLTAIGWYYLMKSHSLVMVAVIFTAMTIIVLGEVLIRIRAQQHPRDPDAHERYGRDDEVVRREHGDADHIGQREAGPAHRTGSIADQRTLAMLPTCNRSHASRGHEPAHQYHFRGQASAAGAVRIDLTLAAHPDLSDAQDVSGGAWGGSVYDATAILRVIAAGKRALASEGSSSVPSP